MTCASDQCGFQRVVRPLTWLACSNAFSSCVLSDLLVLTNVFSSVSLDFGFVLLSYSSLLFMLVCLSISLSTTCHVSLFLYKWVFRLGFLGNNKAQLPVVQTRLLILRVYRSYFKHCMVRLIGFLIDIPNGLTIQRNSERSIVFPN